jgi:tRNA dimethylallyltransferase
MATAPLIVIVGPTASGKTSAAITIAKKWGGEIISADSRTIYTGMDIATAKPSLIERQGIPHWGIDLITPGEPYSAADFKQYAVQKIAEIRNRGNVPILVGGTGLYIDSVVFDFIFGAPVDVALRQRLQEMSLDQLHIYCKNNNVVLPENYKNKRYVVRAIETADQTQKRRSTPIESSIIVGITTDKALLRQRIQDRTDAMFEAGVVDEARDLSERYGWDSQAMTSNIYPIVRHFIDGELTLEEVKAKNVTRDWRLAKRQMTWLKRNEFIHWLPLKEVNTYIASTLANTHKA